jgi:hypothetical protein
MRTETESASLAPTSPAVPAVAADESKVTMIPRIDTERFALRGGRPDDGAVAPSIHRIGGLAASAVTPSGVLAAIRPVGSTGSVRVP